MKGLIMNHDLSMKTPKAFMFDRLKAAMSIIMARFNVGDGQNARMFPAKNTDNQSLSAGRKT